MVVVGNYKCRPLSRGTLNLLLSTLIRPILSCPLIPCISLITQGTRPPEQDLPSDSSFVISVKQSLATEALTKESLPTAASVKAGSAEKKRGLFRRLFLRH